MDFRYVGVPVTRTFDDLGSGDLFQDEEETGSDEEHPEYGAVKNEEDPEGDVQHVCPVENLGGGRVERDVRRGSHFVLHVKSLSYITI